MLGVPLDKIPKGSKVSDEPVEFVDLDEEAADKLEADWESGDLTPNEYAERWSAIYGGKEARNPDGTSAGFLASGPEGELTFDFGLSWVPDAEEEAPGKAESGSAAL